MRTLELLAPARNADIGIAAIDCGADAVYIGAPDFGARKDAGNSFDDIARLCGYARRFGVRVFVTFNTTIRDEELEEAHAQMLAAQEAGASAFIIRDLRVASWKDITVPLHASTQCAIRDVEAAKLYEAAGCERIILERALPLEKVREICGAVGCEVEFFVHGALCVCYSGECRLSEHIDGRSADRGECIQACRSLYDLVDDSGRVIVARKALLSLKDFNLIGRLGDLADAGVCSFKIEGRLKNASYVRNVVRAYDRALDALVAANPDKYRRASRGRVEGGFEPDVNKTFNRGYTEFFLDGKRGRWAAMDAPKSMGAPLGAIVSVKPRGNSAMTVEIKPVGRGVVLSNGDGFAVVAGDSIIGFRGDVCEGSRIMCKAVPSLRPGMMVYRNLDAAFEKEMESNRPQREIAAEISLTVSGRYKLEFKAVSADGREVVSVFNEDVETAQNRERAEALIRGQLAKRSEQYHFSFGSLDVRTAGGALPLLSAATLNSIRRLLASDLDAVETAGAVRVVPETLPELPVSAGASHGPLMRSRYCIKYELGLCPVRQDAQNMGKLYLVNNGRRFLLGFDCRNCEMTVEEDET